MYEDLFNIAVFREDFALQNTLDFIEEYKKKEQHPYFLGLYFGGIATAYIYHEQIDSMLKYYTLACDSYNKEKSYKLEAMLNTVIASEFWFLEDLKEAEKYIEKAERILNEKLIPIGQDIPIFYNVHAGICMSLGKYHKGLKSSLKRIRILERDSNSYYLHLVYSYNNLATAYSDLEDFEHALIYYRKALSIVQSPEHYSIIEAASFTYNLGATYTSLGKHSKAKQAFLKSLSMLRTADEMDREMQIDYINNCHYLVDCYKTYNQDSALFYAQEAEKMNKEFPYRVSNTLLCFSDIYLLKNKFDLAREYGNKALQVALEEYGEKNDFVINAHEALGRVAIAENDYKKALYHCQKSLEAISINFSDEHGLSNPTLNNVLLKGELVNILNIKLHYLEHLYLQDDPSITPEILYASAKLAAEALEQMNKSMKNEGSKLFWLNKKAIPLFEEAIQIALDIYNKTGEQEHLDEAFMLSERSKSMLMIDALQESNASSFGGIPDSLVLLEKELQKILTEAEKQRFDAIMAANEAEVKLQDSLIFHYKHQVDDLAHIFELEYPKYHKLKYTTKVANIKEVQAFLDHKTTFIEYFEGKSKIYAFSITKDKASVQEMEQGKEYLDDIISFQETIAGMEAVNQNAVKAHNKFIGISQQFYTKLIQNCLINETSDRLIIIPDGQLGYLPFEVLLNQKVTPLNQKKQNVNFASLPYLIKDYKISYNYSGTLLLSQRENKKGIPNGNILALAPSYTTAPPTWRGKYEQRLRRNLTKLPGAKKEVQYLEDNFQGQFLKGKLASEENFKTEAEKYGILHLAMHGLLDNIKPELSGLAMEENDSRTEDNMLYAYEIKQLELNASLVVLSACETGIGKYQRGEGVLSVGRGFMYAGVPSLLMTMWSLNDFSSSIIVEQFYKNLGAGMEKDAAIRNAKLAYLDNYTGIAAHPALWACFVQVGDYSAITINKKGWPMYYYYALGGLLIVVVGLLGFRKARKNSRPL